MMENGNEFSVFVESEFWHAPLFPVLRSSFSICCNNFSLSIFPLFPLRLKRSIDDGIDFRHEIRRIASNFFQTLPGNAPLSFFLSPINALEHTSAILAIAFGFRNTLVRPHFPCIFLIFYTFARTFVSSALTKLGMGAHFQPSRVQNKY